MYDILYLINHSPHTFPAETQGLAHCKTQTASPPLASSGPPGSTDVETHTLRKYSRACVGSGRQVHSSWHSLGDLIQLAQKESHWTMQMGEAEQAMRIS